MLSSVSISVARCAALLVFCVLPGMTVFAQDTSPAQGSAPGPVQESEGPNPVTRAAVQRGILQCASRVEQVTRFLGFNPQSAAMLMAPAPPADRRLFSVQIETASGAGGNAFIDVDFAPGQANGCGAAYQAINFWPQNCDAVANGQFPGFRRLPVMQRDVFMLDGGPATKVFLMRAGDTGCISIKKEIVL